MLTIYEKILITLIFLNTVLLMINAFLGLYEICLINAMSAALLSVPFAIKRLKIK